ncbi:MAG TPA: succinate dehydrogenase, cytochrome b556 subunit [Thermomicrobiales bacterium]|nr:succinate dehydrogenase, cytochrome b556 subunit [Thermomicrobiales bacterium]
MASVSNRSRVNLGAGVIPGTERLFWYFLRVSGVLLILLAGGHLVITHYINVPSETTFEFVANRWANPFWITFDLLLLFAALWHGMIGLRLAATDLIRNKGWRQIAFGTIYALGIIFTVLGVVNIFTFDEEAARNNEGPLSGAMWFGDLIAGSLFVFAAIIYIAVIVLAVWIFKNLRGGIVPIYNGDVGQYAWVLHRATGIGVTFFLLIHIIDIMLIGWGRDVYDHTVSFYANPFIIPMEIMLVGAVIYHTLNGIRVIAINFSAKGPVREKTAFWWVLAATVLLTIPSGIVILLHEL